MNTLIDQLLAIWYACLIDHHKDRDCYFYIERKLCAYGESKWRCYHNGYLYKWEETFSSYEKCQAFLTNKLTEMIRDECESYLVQEGNPSWQSYTDGQIATMKNNLIQLNEVLTQCVD